MNKTFLEYVAEDIISKYGTDLSRIAVVFPNKRAALFLNEHLARLAGQPVWSPAYITISDLFRQHTDLKTADPIKLICDIHKSFTKCTGIDETLDHFYGWGQLLLADFDDIDKNMADADSIFCNLKDIHELDDISYLDDEQKEMLARFFANFSDDIDSELKKRFLSLWSHFGDIYHDYNRRLTEQGIGYEGAIYRKVASEQTLHLKYDKYLFVGFNLLQKVERVLFSRLMKEGKAKFYWDFDEYYMPSPSHHLTTSPYIIRIIAVGLYRHHLVGLVVGASRLRHDIELAFRTVALHEYGVSSVAHIYIYAPRSAYKAVRLLGFAQVLQTIRQHVRVEEHEHEHHAHQHSQGIRLPRVAAEQHTCPAEADEEVDKSLEREQTAKVEVDIGITVHVHVQVAKEHGDYKLKQKDAGGYQRGKHKDFV